MVLKQALAERGVGLGLHAIEARILRIELERVAQRRERGVVRARLLQRADIGVGDGARIGIALLRLGIDTVRPGHVAGSGLDARGERLDHRARDGEGLQPLELAPGLLHPAGAQQRRGEAVMRRRLACVAVLAQGRLEARRRIARIARLGAQLRFHELKFRRIGMLLVGHRRGLVLHVGDALGGHRMGAQITGQRAVIAHARGTLHLLEEGRHGARVEVRLLQRLQADAVGFPLEVA